jgi:transcriptional regulator with AAA-type ATPase domain
VAVNAADPDDNLFSDTLFGHLKGAYTGAELIAISQSNSLFLSIFQTFEVQQRFSVAV